MVKDIVEDRVLLVQGFRLLLWIGLMIQLEDRVSGYGIRLWFWVRVLG